MAKTVKFTIDNYKCTDGWYEMAHTLLFEKFKNKHKNLDEDEIQDKFYNEVSKIFRYGEYASLTIEVDENFNIVGGYIHGKNKLK